MDRYPTPPRIDRRRFSELVAQLRAMAPHYTPEWKAAKEGDSGLALLKIFSFLIEGVVGRLNQAPFKNLVAFLDMLGISLLPAQPARTPLQFKLAAGTEDAVRVPVATQATAQTAQGEFPFETEEELLAVPSALLRAVAVDPEKDAIYNPPPGFLERELAAVGKPPYKLMSFSAEGSSSFQLDRVDDLAKKDFLRISPEQDGAAAGIASCCPDNGNGGIAVEAGEHLIIDDISGEIVTLTDKLQRDYPAQTRVEKVARFHVFESKDRQKHILYLGHPDFFNVKSAARFTMEVTLLAGSELGLTPLALVWEYWGEMAGQEGDDWRSFQIEADGSGGFSRDGRVELSKPEGEIKERDVNEITSRWVRCRLKEPIPSSKPRPLPQLDEVRFLVRSAGEGLPADQAFSNTTPLDLPSSPAGGSQSVGGTFPFGTEPRLFDSFYLASQEIFSKKGARISIDVEFDLADTLAEPAAVRYLPPSLNKELLKVFARGPKGELVDLSIDADPLSNDGFLFTSLGQPADSKLALGAAPSVRAAGSQIYVFVRAENGHIYESFFNGVLWFWIDLGLPPGAGENFSFQFNPSAPEGTAQVFAVGSDGALYSVSINPANGSPQGSWQKTAAAPVQLASSPFALAVPDVSTNSTTVTVFAAGIDGGVYAFDGAWSKLQGGSEPMAAPGARPAAGLTFDFTGPLYLVWVRDQQGELYVYDSLVGVWVNLGKPAADIKVASDPIGQAEGVFVRGSDDQLWQRTFTKWEPQGRPGQSDLRLSPSQLLYTMEDKLFLSIFSASRQNTLLEYRRQLGEDGSDLWLEYKDPDDVALRPALSWEYWNGKGWVALKDVNDGTDNFLGNGLVSFKLPANIAPTDVSGQENFWIRSRIKGGGFGEATFELERRTRLQSLVETPPADRLVSDKSSIRPPLITSLTLSYQSVEAQFPKHCLAFNNLDYVNQSDACRTEGRHFRPFLKLEAVRKAFYLGFEKAFKGGPVKVFFAAKELAKADRHEMEWAFYSDNDWQQLAFDDGAEGLTQQGILALQVPEGFQVLSLFGEDLYWIRGILTEGEFTESPLLSGVFPNTTRAFQAATVKNEILGSSDGQTPFQAFQFQKFPVQPGEVLRVRESLTDEERAQLLENFGAAAVEELRGRLDQPLGTWVLWSPVDDLFESRPEDRHYVLDRANGQLQFGDGIHGRIPPGGTDNIRVVSYQAGGGTKGNVLPGEIRNLATALAGVESVVNPVGADGGADTASLEQMLEIGPRQISHRGRAVTREDFEQLAREASRKVAKARCLPGVNPLLQRDAGWVSVYIVPNSTERLPRPSLQLRRVVREYLEERCDSNLSVARQVFVGPPQFVPIGVSVDLFSQSLNVVSKVENEARRRLDAFFHPLTGGPNGAGWDFGRPVAASDIYALLEAIDGADHAENLRLTFDGQSRTDLAEIDDHELIAGGKHEIRMKVAGLGLKG